MKLIFAGTPAFARVALERLLAAGFGVPLVLTQPDRPAGRGMKLQASPVKALALERGIAVSQPRSLRLDGKYPEDAMAARAAIDAAQADVMVVAAYGLILPRWVLDTPRLGCLNIHASLLPRWRGAAPIHRAIEAGDAETGITIMQMDDGLDTGDMLLRERIAIRDSDTTDTLHDRLAVLGGRLIVEALEMAACGGLHAEPQPQEGVTYAHKIEKAEAAIDWTQPAAAIARRVRAFDPFPGAHTTHARETIKVWAAEALPGNGRAGEALAVEPEGITVACGEGALRLTVLQRAGGKRLPAADFLRGFALAPGEVLGGGA
ncbi:MULTISPECIES: methionyl-tRNA formyltransferase [Hydrogenophaga]|uniref:Methionyl-tRNA formyltransferase n=1 Tax=Hydrogenophaga intermedia TaxID=65786 RepID=A0A1L1PJB5_HYDIT|nr:MULTISPECIES: methionyl-tRNA formyltransferase [Hydrogenophaga]AOS81794.1 methionyl-tRNA formyltransferase [Hydrogenophaga sp. PBC]TMU72990.1 methionyl-tRNA formyltransferase [Hydrogenophaga intermedia]CDN89480.1 Methionyl-tRNA formyltransferase [Hydrogenophaga intermedia]